MAPFCIVLGSVTALRARSDPTHQHFGHQNSSIHGTGNHLQNSYTQTGSYMHIINDGLIGGSSSASSSSLHHLSCSSTMECESPVTSTTGLGLGSGSSFHSNSGHARLAPQSWAPLTPCNS